MGYKDYQGTGFIIEGTATYITEGSEYDFMKEKYRVRYIEKAA